MAQQPPKQSPIPDIPDVGVRWSKKKLAATFAVILLLSAAGVSFFLLRQEYGKNAVSGVLLPPRLISKSDKAYTNDYWGFRFNYPGDWWQATGSFDEGDYYFSSENINFAGELSAGEALLEVQPYHNLKQLGWADWLADREQNYFPNGTVIKSEDLTVNGAPAKRYLIQLKKNQNNVGVWDMVIVSKDTLRKCIFILKTSDTAADERYQAAYQAILDSLTFYQGFGT
jgi:hypothetical protein